MAKYRKKPVVIEAFRMTKERRSDNSDWPVWLSRAWGKDVEEVGSVFCSPDGVIEGTPDDQTPLFVNTLEGTLRIDWDDFIIQGVQDELYPCKPDIFAETYELVEETT